MILTWYNNNNNCFYTKFYNTYILNNYYVGFKNSYDHEVVQILIIRDNKLYNVTNYNDYIRQTTNPKKEHKVLSFFRKLI